MQIFPAIDLSGGQVVRLYQGDYDKMTVYGQDPCAAARDFLEAGARYLHVVDLDGAKDGTAANFASITALAKQGGFYLEVGGGIRTEERIRRYLELGVDRCILGTAAVKDFDFTARMAQLYGEQIAVGVDTRDGYVAVNGWKERSGERGVEFCRLTVVCRGDTQVDGHHSVEDIGICLGQAFTKALGEKRGITRYGQFLLPMDETLVLCACDLSGRDYLGWAVTLPAASVGGFDTELAKEFWLAFVRNCPASVHICQLAGENTHHILEAVFKGMGRTLKMAAAIDEPHRDEIPSTKGVL